MYNKFKGLLGRWSFSCYDKQKNMS